MLQSSLYNLFCFIFIYLKIFRDLFSRYDVFDAYLFVHASSLNVYRSSRREKFLGKGVLKICCKITGKHPWRSAISTKLQSKATLLKRTSACVFSCKFSASFRTTFPRNNSGRLPLCILIHVYSPMDFINESVTFFLIHVAWCFVFPLLFVHGVNKNCFIMDVPHDFLF